MDLVTFTEEILNGKLHFLRSDLTGSPFVQLVLKVVSGYLKKRQIKKNQLLLK